MIVGTKIQKEKTPFAIDNDHQKYGPTNTSQKNLQSFIYILVATAHDSKVPKHTAGFFPFFLFFLKKVFEGKMPRMDEFIQVLSEE